MKAIRILGRSIRDAFKSVFRNFSLSVASITCIVITLILVSISLMLSSNVNNFIQDTENDLSIIVYLKQDVNEEQIKDIESKIKSMASYESLVFKSKDEWKAEIAENISELKPIIEGLEENPLDDSILVYVKSVNDLKATTSAIQEIEGVESATYGADSVDQLIVIFKIIEQVAAVIVIALVLVTAFLISNTIRLTIYSRRNEIEIMRLVGTSNMAIKLPFEFEGLFLGVIGAIIPVLLTIYGYIFVYDRFKTAVASYRILLVTPLNILPMICAILVVIGGIVGMLGSSYAVRKYLKI